MDVSPQMQIYKSVLCMKQKLKIVNLVWSTTFY